MAAATTPTASAARTAAGQVASSSTEPVQRSRDENSRNRGSHETRAPLASRHPNDDRPPARTRHRCPAKPIRRRLAMALRDRPASRTGRSPYDRNHQSRRPADTCCSHRHNTGSPWLAANPPVPAQPRLVHRHSAPSTRRLRRGNDLLQPRQDPRHRVDSPSTVRRTSPALVPGRHQHRRLHHQPSRTHVSVLGAARRCPSRHTPPTPCHPRRHTPTALFHRRRA